MAEWEQIMGSGIMMRHIVNGTGESASMGTVVTCNLRGFLATSDDVYTEPFEDLTNQQFKIGESDAFPGLELTLRHSYVGEKFAMKCASKFGYGGGRPAVSNGGKNNEHSTIIAAVPADANLYYEVVVTNHRNEGVVDRPLLDTIMAESGAAVTTEVVEEVPEQFKEEYARRVALQDITLRKDCGNRWFSYQDYARAARAYSKGTQVADNYFKAAGGGAGGEEKDEEENATTSRADAPVVLAYVACLNNLSACYLGLGENLKAKDMCVKVLEFDPANVKALLRAAKATLAMHDFKECDMCLRRALEIEPGNAAAAAEVVRLRRAERDYAVKSKEIQRNMAQKLFPTAATSTAAAPAAATTATEPEKTSSSIDTATVGGAESNGHSEAAVMDDSTETDAPLVSDPPDAEHATADKQTAEPVAIVAVGSQSGQTTSTAAAATAAAYSAGYSASNLVLLLVTSLAVLAVSVYIAVFARHEAR